MSKEAYGEFIDYFRKAPARYVCKYTHAHTHTRTHAHTNTLSLSPSLSLPLSWSLSLSLPLSLSLSLGLSLSLPLSLSRAHRMDEASNVDAMGDADLCKLILRTFGNTLDVFQELDTDNVGYLNQAMLLAGNTHILKSAL